VATIKYPDARCAVSGAALTVVVPCYNERANVAPLVERLRVALNDTNWEVVFVDDNSPDGTADEVRRLARQDARVRCIQRIARRGLASAVIEGALSSSADYIAVIDGDLQHDETRLPDLLARLRSGGADIAVASRYLTADAATGLASARRRLLSAGAIRLLRGFFPVQMTDPLSGFFALRRELFASLAPRLTGQGFKILLDLLLTARAPLRIAEVQADFVKRTRGESKLDILVLLQFLGLMIDKLCRGIVPLRFISFACVGALGVLVNVAALTAARAAGLDFVTAQAIGTLVAMAANFELNNVITYRDMRLRGAEMWRGLGLFILVCSIGAFANVGIARLLYQSHVDWTLAGALGAAIGVVWNYAMSATLVWTPASESVVKVGERSWRLARLDEVTE
jgi:dolichol-phosphate mannosyltransferase